MRRPTRVAVVGIVCGALAAVGSLSTPALAAPEFGFNYNPQIGSPPPAPWVNGETAASLQGAIKSGSVHRFPISWKGLQPNQGQAIQWGALDARVAPLAQAGFKLLPNIESAPSWATNLLDVCAGDPCPPADNATALGAWQSFVAQVTEHLNTGVYAGKLVGLEVWNEPNAWFYWKTLAGPDPARYSRVLCSAYNGVRSKSSTVPVLVGGLIPWDSGDPWDPPNGSENNLPTGDSRHKTMRVFLDGLYAAPGAAGCFNGISIHNYPNQHSPDIPGEQFLDSLDDLRQITTLKGDAGRDIWITEFGYAAEGTGAISQSLQADWLVCAYRLMVDEPDVRAFLVHSLVDIAGTDLWSRMGVYNDGSPPQAREAVGALHDLFAGGAPPPVSSCA